MNQPSISIIKHPDYHPHFIVVIDDCRYADLTFVVAEFLCGLKSALPASGSHD